MKMLFKKKDHSKNNRDFKVGIIIDTFSVVLVDMIILGCISIYLNYRDSINIKTSGGIIVISVAVISIVSSMISGRNLANKIVIPINFCSDRLKELSEGNLESSGESHAIKDDEIGRLISTMNNTINGINLIIDDISYNLGAIENSDFTTEVGLDYVGDYDTIKKSIEGIIISLNSMMHQIDESAEQVAEGAMQVAAGSQALSQGSTEQASSVEELAANINEMSEYINENARNAENAKNATIDAVTEVNNGSEQIKDLLMAINRISESSFEVGKIIKAIEDIAFQTNILALNAAVEAARAGAAGKGFAVVADEVRNLAMKSADAANDTTELIENSIKAIEDGTKIADKTDKLLKLIVDKTNVSLKLVEDIAIATKRQAIGVSQIAEGIDQVSSVVQNNSATAEESAAASQELSSQAHFLKDMIKGIKLKDTESVKIL